MKKILLILAATVLTNQSVLAITLSEALYLAYKNNPELNAERENLSLIHI